MTERVELHLHTTASDDISVITPKDLIKTAVQMGHKAVAVTCLNSVQDFPELESCQCKYGKDIKIIYGAEVYYLKNDTVYGIALLAKNEEGLKGLYRVLSSIEKWRDRKVVDWQVIADNRKNLLCGALTWIATELENEELYDYIAIVPSAHSEEREKQWQLYKESNIPVVAVGNCHYIDEQDSICRKVVQWIDAQDYDKESTHYRSTQQALHDFSYLGDDAAYEVVVTNSNLIADQIELIFPSCGYFPSFTLPNAQTDLPRICRENLRGLYGDNPPKLITERLDEELALMTQQGSYSVYMLLHQLCSGLYKAGVQTGARGMLGTSLVAFLLEISDTNPLPPHYRYPGCKHTEFVTGVHSGYDLPKNVCPVCGATMCGEGHNLPYIEDKTANQMVPELNIATSQIEKARQLLIEHVGEDRIARAGSVSTAGRGANGYVQRYQDSCGEMFTNEKATQITKKLMHIKVNEWSMPGSFLLLPDGMEFEDITPITHLDPPECCIHRRSHLNGYDIDHILQRINLLGYSVYDRIRELRCLTKTTPENIDYSDPNVYTLFRDLNTCGIPNFSTESCKAIIRGVIEQDITLCFSDLVRILGMNFGLVTWNDNAENLIKQHPFTDLVGSREDIYLKLQEYAIDPLTVYITTEAVRKGRFCKNTDENRAIAQTLVDAGVPQWYVESMRKIGYLTSKAHIAHNVKTAATLAWFKVYYPKEFYNVTLQDLGAKEFLHYSNEALLKKLEAIDRCDHYKDKPQEAIELLLEARHRNIPLKL